MKKFLFLLFFPAICLGQINVSPDDYAWKPVGEPGFAPQVNNRFDFASAPDGTPYVIFYSNGIHVMKFTGTEWMFVGNTVDNLFPSEISIDISRSGVPYFAYNDNNGISVMKLNGSIWEYVGAQGFVENSEELVIKVDTAGFPLIASQNSNGSYLSVMKYDGTTWNYVGLPSFTSGSADSPGLDINNLNEPVVAYVESLSYQSISVQVFHDGQWQYLGPPDFIEDVGSVTLRIDHAGVPYIAFYDFSSGSTKTIVMRFNGTTWENVGSDAISDGIAAYPDLSFNQADNPFVVYAESNTGYKVSVKSLRDGTWQLVGDNGFSSDTVRHPLIEMMNNNPIVVFADRSESYRLTSKSYDSVYLGVEERSAPMFNFFPNPASQFIHIKEDCYDKGFYKISDLQGRCVIDWKAISKDIYTGNLKSGLYIISLISEGVVSNQKLIIL